MEVKPGYKQTEVGDIPDDWQTATLGALTVLMTNGFVGTATRHYASNDNGVLYIQGYNVEENSFNFHGVKYVTEEFHRANMKSCLREGDLLTVQTGDVGLTTVIPESLAGSNCHALIISRFDKRRIAPKLISFYLNSSPGRSRLKLIETGTTMKHLNVGDVLHFSVPLPPTKAEQDAIAEALSDADALIESVEQLLAKKRQLKQGVMQELLTGKRRLPGFSAEWEIVNLDGVLDRITGVWGETDAAPDHARMAHVIRAGDVSQDGLLTGTAQRYLSDVEFSKAHCRLDDIVITTSGNGLGKVWWSDGRPDVAASNFVRVLRPLPGKSQGRYLSYVIRSEAGLRQLQEHTATSAYPNLRPSFFAAFWIPMPALSEQTAIAAILSEMDVEIAALDAMLAKARRIKEGMMRELLTGRIRLV